MTINTPTKSLGYGSLLWSSFSSPVNKYIELIEQDNQENNS